MRARFLTAIACAVQPGRAAGRAVVLDAAILLEAGWDDLCDLVVFVDAPRGERIRRASLQRGWSTAAFEARERAQMPCDEKRRRAALVITNAAGLDSLRREVDRLEVLLSQSPCPPAQSARERPEAAGAKPVLPVPERMVPDFPSPYGDPATRWRSS
jgi:dephospho-CoA kinase